MEHSQLLLPRKNVYGNYLWLERDESLMNKLREIGYTVSPFPEGDGFVFWSDFIPKRRDLTGDEAGRIITDFQISLQEGQTFGCNNLDYPFFAESLSICN